MLRLGPRLLLVLSILAIAAGALYLSGCSTDQTPTAPNSSASAMNQMPAVPVRLDSPGMAAAKTSQERVTPGLLRQSGVLGSGLSADEKGKPVIVIYTERADVAGLPHEIDGIPTRVVVTGKVVAYAKPGGGGTLQMGTSTGNDLECASGTLGCVVVKNGTEYFLSNNHVFARENAANNGERIDAPGRYDGHPVCAQTPKAGSLADFQPISFTNNNTIDAAIALPDPARAYSQVEAGGYDPSSTVAAPSVGLAVKKTGRTSNLTHGNIQAINVTIQVQYSNGGIATFVNQIQTPGNFIRSGDSGSLMVTETGANPVGLCFAGGSGGSFANPISNVLSRFNVTVK
jgi:hypothetical protein